MAGGLGSNPLAYSYDGQNWWQSLNGPTIFPSGVVNGVTWNATYWLASGTGTAGNTQAYSTDGIIWQVDQNNSSATLFSGNTGLALASRKTGQIAQAQTASLQTQITTLANQQIGVGQRWQRVLASRAAGVAYVNNTQRPIEVLITMYNPNAGYNGFFAYLDGSDLGVMIGVQYNYIPISFIVPIGSSYSVGVFGSAVIYNWVELR